MRTVSNKVLGSFTFVASVFFFFPVLSLLQAAAFDISKHFCVFSSAKISRQQHISSDLQSSSGSSCRQTVSGFMLVCNMQRCKTRRAKRLAGRVEVGSRSDHTQNLFPLHQNTVAVFTHGVELSQLRKSDVSWCNVC